MLSVSPAIGFSKVTTKEINMLTELIGFYHDVGKYMDFFQEYLLQKNNSVLKNHAHISACFLFNLLKQKISGNTEEIDTMCLNFLAYLVVRLHHGNLSLYGLFKEGSENWGQLKRQAENMINNADKILVDFPEKMRMTSNDFIACLDIEALQKDRLFSLMPQFLKTRAKSEEWFFILVYLFSVLIDADKLNSAGIKKKKSNIVSHEKVVEYIKKKQNNNFVINNKREQARKTIIDTIVSMSDKEIINTKIFTLTAPTGIGKTLAALESALLLRERLAVLANYKPRIIAAIPFINIIEQTKDDYINILGNELKVLINHQLADIAGQCTREFEDEGSLEKILLELESWEADVILTTFVQLFHSIFSASNRALKKLNKIAGSIIILDEIQSLPEKYLPLIGATIQKLAEYYGTKFILMTATQPKIIEFGDLLLQGQKRESKVVELLSDNERYFRDLRRTKFIPILDKKMTTDEFIALLKEKWDRKSSVLVVVNTIKRSIEIYNKIAEEVCFQCPVLYLSTNIIPLKRREVISEAKNLLAMKVPFLMVSTQTIEAGVDLDFDMAFRDLAPLESVVQTAGRVNREGKKGDYLPVYIVEIASDNSYVYGLHNLTKTREYFKGKNEIPETAYRELINTYYLQALENGVAEESRTIWEEGILKLDFSRIMEFKLIENTGEIADVFVEWDNCATGLADAYEKLVKSFYENDENIFVKKAQLKSILAKMSMYMIQVRISRIKKNLPVPFSARNGVNATFYWIPPGQIKDYYDEYTGFRDEAGLAFL